MANLIERYIYDVTRRLPEEEREEVGMELSANINDMLPENAEEEQIKAVLYELSAPALLAEEYRQKLRYLISPAVYDAYIRMLKWVVPMVGVILLVVGAISGGIDAISGDGPVSGTEFSISILSNGIAFGLDGAFQSLLWVTVIFIIMDRTGYRKKTNEWKVEDLPEASSGDKYAISLGDSIAELVLTVIFSGIAILLCLDVFPATFVISTEETQITALFSDSFCRIVSRFCAWRRRPVLWNAS